MRIIKLPLNENIIGELYTGDSVVLTGTVYVARDAAHKKLIQAIENGCPLPFDINGQTIYYMGPSPARPGRVIGAAGPTTSGRMDRYTPQLIELGLKGMIGKGKRSTSVKEAIRKYKAVYFAATGGTGALLSQYIRETEIIAYPELGAEAILRLDIEEFPVVVINDIYGNDLYEDSIN